MFQVVAEQSIHIILGGTLSRVLLSEEGDLIGEHLVH